MADKLIFPIGFDLEAGIKSAEGKADVLLRQLEHRMNQRPIQLNVEMDSSKFAMFSRQFTSNIDGISNKIAQANRLWDSMTFDVKFDENGNLSRRAQVVFDAFKQLASASETMGQRLSRVNRQLQQSEAETTRLITAEYDKKQRLINEQIRAKERQAAAEERARQSQLKGVNVGYVDLQKQTEAVKNLRLQYEAILPMLNAMYQKRVDIKVRIDKQFEADINHINAEIARLRQINLQLGAKGDVNAIQANLAAIRQFESELQRISQQKIDLLNTNKINSDLAKLQTEVSSVFRELQTAERKLASDASLNAALDAQSQKVLKLHGDIQKLDQQIAQLNAQGKMYNADGAFSTQATSVLQQRIALTKQLEQEAITGQQAQIKLEQQLREEKRQTERVAKEAERAAKAEAAVRKQAQDAANAENKARQAAYNARVRQGRETQRILQAEEKSIATITAKLQIQQQRLQSANIGSNKFDKIAAEVKRLTGELDKANIKMRELTGQATSGANAQVFAVNKISQEFNNQNGYVENLIKKMAVYATFSSISTFLTRIRDVTAQFELQRVSLGAIIQDQTRANQLFSEIKQFALGSPVSILDLTKYTKQLAAYKIGVDELFDTTKRLADVSVGLGVSMDRVVLAYGQVRARGALYSSEIRQFTEMGIPIVEEIAAKLTKMNGELVTSAQVLELVREGGISFELVKEVFDDMTSAGGMFYNMQTKQGNTLYGMWAKLGDAASVMYEQIGNTDLVNKGMKDGIQALTDLMRNWQSLARIIAMGGIAFVVIKAQMKMAAVSATEVGAKTALYRMELQRLQMQYLSTSGTAKIMTLGQIAYVRVQGMAAIATIAFSNALRIMKSVLISTGWGALAVALGYLIDKLFFAKSSADELKESLEKLYEETIVEQNKSVRNFEYLANVATDSTKGYKERKDALDELQRTYKNILPQEVLELEYLTKLKGNYDSLTNSIRGYVAEQQRRKAIDTIAEEYGAEKQKYERKLTDYFRDEGWSEQEIARFWEKFYKSAADKSKLLEQVISEASEKAGHKIGVEQIEQIEKIEKHAIPLYKVVREENQAIEQNEERMKEAASATNEFAEAQAKLADQIANANFFDTSGKKIDRDSYLGQQVLTNANIEGIGSILKEAFEKAGLEWQSGFGNLINRIDASKPELISSLDFTAIISYIEGQLNNFKEKGIKDIDDARREMLQDLLLFVQQAQQKYMELAPSNPVVNYWQIRFRQLAGTVGGLRNTFNKYLMQNDETLEAYNQRLKNELKSLKANIKGLLATQQGILHSAIFDKAIKQVQYQELDKQIKEAEVAVKTIEKVLGEQPNFKTQKPKSVSKKPKVGSKSDPRLQNLKEEISLVQKLYNEYKQLEKQEGKTAAAADMRKLAGRSIDKFKERYKFDLPTNAKSLAAALEILYKKMAALPKKAFPALGKDLKELRWTIEKVNIDESQKKIELELKSLADRISRTKIAKEFYEKILSQTGDVELAAKVTLSVYGDTGEELKNALLQQIRKAFTTDIKTGATIDLSTAVDDVTGAIDYNKLSELAEQYKDVLVEGRAELRKKLIEEGRKTSAAQAQQWLKDIEKAKDYAQQRIDLAAYTANQIAAINARSDLDQDTKDTLIKGYQEREAKQLAKLQYDEFKDSAMYVQIFEDLDNASTTALRNMRDRLIALKGQWRNLDPMQVKELTKAVADIDAQIAKRNPFKTLAYSFKELAKARPQKVIDAELIAATAELEAREKALAAATQKYTAAQTAQLNAETAVTEARKKLALALEGSEGKETPEVAAAREELRLKVEEYNAVKALSKGVIALAKEEVDAARDKYNEQRGTVNSLTEESAIRKKLIANIENANQKIDKYQDQISESLNGLRKMMEAFGASDEELQFFDDIVGGLNEIVDAGQQAASAVGNIMSGNPALMFQGVTQGISAIGGLVSGITNIFSAGRVKRANKEIKRQQELLDQLEYTYSRLEKAADKAFGSGYINNLKQQQKVLQAQADAYQKQYKAEMSKGKKSDEAKAKEFLGKRREILDEIADMQNKIAEQMTGTDVASAARDFANAWLEAYASFGNTTAAIKEKFNDMIKNMIVESIMANTVQMALQPMFDEMNRMYKSGASMTDVLSYAFGQAATLSETISNGLAVNAKYMESLGMDIKSLYDNGDNLKGIAKEVSSASSEEINANTAALNTQNYYVSHLPNISENVMAIRMLMEGGNVSVSKQSGVDVGALMQQSLENQAMIVHNTAEAVAECRNIAARCQEQTDLIRKVIVPKNQTGAYKVYVGM